MNKNDIKLMSESYKQVMESGLGVKPAAPKEVGSIPVSPKTQEVTVAKTNPQDESIQTMMRAWRITPTPENIQNIRNFLTQMQRRSDKAPEDYGAPMHEME